MSKRRLVRSGSGCAPLAASLPDRVTILAEKAEKAEEIDVKRAQSAKERAEKRLSDLQNSEIDFDRAAVSLQRAISRIRVSSKRSSQ